MVEKKDVKATVKAAAEAAKPAEAKTEAKPAAPEKVEAKAEAAVPVKAEAAPDEKEAKAAPAKKTTARPAAAVHFQFDGKDLVAKDVLDRAVKAFKKSHRGVEIKTIDLYIVANEGAAYYVVNGEGGDDYKIIL